MPKRTEGEDENEYEEPQLDQPQKRGRPSRSKQAQDEVRPAKEPRKRGRPSLSKEAPADDIPPAEEPKKRGRPRRSDVSEAAPTQHPPDTAAPTDNEPPKRRGRKSTTSAQQQQEADTQPSPVSPSPERKAPRPKRKPYLYIAPKQREIPVSVISSKWSPLNPSSVELARQTLQLAERPVLQTYAPGPRRDAATAAIRIATKRVVNSISRGLPFPPASRYSVQLATRKKKSYNGKNKNKRKSAAADDDDGPDGREVELDLEAVISETEALEKRLEPLLHSIEILRAEEKRMDAVIERDTAELSTLSQNSRRELNLWRESLRKSAHPLLPERWDPDADGREKLVLARDGEGPLGEWVFAVCFVPSC